MNRQNIDELNSLARKLRYSYIAILLIAFISLVLFAQLFTAQSQSFSNGGCLSFILFLLAFAFPLGGIVFVILLRRYEKQRLTLQVTYEPTLEEKTDFEKISRACETLTQTSRLLCMSSADRSWCNARVLKTMLPHPRANTFVWSIVSSKITLDFLPDQLLIWESGEYESVSYSTIEYQFQLTTSTLLCGDPPNDAEIVRYAWLHSRKDGGRDLRYKNNYQVPVVQYGQIALVFRNGKVIYLQTSNSRVAQNFSSLMAERNSHSISENYSHKTKSKSAKRVEFFDQALRICVEMKHASTCILQDRLGIDYGRAAAILAALEREGFIGASDGSSDSHPVMPKAFEIVASWDRSQQNRANSSRSTSNGKSQIESSLKLFDLTYSATFEEITRAYRQKASMYHPDKVNHLAPEFKQLAETKTREINEAFEILKRFCGNRVNQFDK